MKEFLSMIKNKGLSINNLFIKYFRLILAMIRSIDSYIKMIWVNTLIVIIIMFKTLKFYVLKFMCVVSKVPSFLKSMIIGHSYHWLLLSIIICSLISIFLKSWPYADYCWILVQAVLIFTILSNLNETN